MIPVDGALSFDELQLRLHPAASRVQKLSAAHPAVYIVLDLLAEDRKSFLKLPLRQRRELLEKFARSANLRHAKGYAFRRARLIIALQAIGSERPVAISTASSQKASMPRTLGERTAAMKVKHLRTADCIVGGFRYATGKRVIGSLLLGLYDHDHLLHHVGSSPGSKHQNAAR